MENPNSLPPNMPLIVTVKKAYNLVMKIIKKSEDTSEMKYRVTKTRGLHISRKK